MIQQRHLKRRLVGLSSLVGLTTCAVFASAVAPAQAHPSNGNLPGGTGISVSITSPASGAVLSPGAATVTGRASIGTGVPVANTALIYVLDVSGSTISPGGCGGDQNGDGNSDFILDCEIAAAKALNNSAVSVGSVGEVGAAVFADSGATADVGPAAGVQLITGPNTDAGGAVGRDIDQVLSSTVSGGLGQFTNRSVGGGTNFNGGLGAATTVAAASTKSRKIVAFLSDGFNGTGSVAAAVAAVPANVDIYTFAVGAGASCTGGVGTLQEIADGTGGTCTAVPNVASLPNIVPGVIASQLTSLKLTVDGGAPIAITNVTPTPPQNGPANVTYSVNTPALTTGSHQLCVTANGTDSGGAGSVVDCHTVSVQATGGAFAVQATGLITVPRTPDAVCPPGSVQTLVQVNLGIGVINGLNAKCVTAGGVTTAEGQIANASLLLGLVQITNVTATCVADASGNITRSSSVATINGITIGTASGSIGLPGLITVHYNESTTNSSGQLVRNAIRVVKPPLLFGLLGQEIILGSCRLG